MPVDHEDKNKETGNEDKRMPDAIQLLKNMYFQSEEAWTRAVKEFVGSQSFIPILEQISGQYLSLYKATSQNMDRYLANYPIATKKDIARIAELVVSVEDKVDNLESQMSDNISSLAASLIKLVDYQSSLKNELSGLRQDIRILQEKVLATDPEAERRETSGEKTDAPRTRGRSRKKELPEEQSLAPTAPVESKKDQKPAPAAKVKRSRKKQQSD